MPALAEAAHLGRRDWTRRRRGDWTYAAEVQRPSIGCIVFTAGGLALSVSVLSLSSTAAPLVARLMLFVGSAVRPDGELALRLQRCGARPVCVAGVDDAQRAATQVVFDAAVVDAALLQSPDPQRLMRLRYALNCPLLVVADHADEVDEILALEQGADDYLARPVSARRFSARLTALARPPATCKPAAVDNMAVAGWRLDLATRRLHKAGRCVELPEMLATLLDLLLGEADRVVSREQLLQGLRSLGSSTDARGVMTYVYRLRRLLRAHGVTDFDITSIAGRGYLLRAAG